MELPGLKGAMKICPRSLKSQASQGMQGSDESLFLISTRNNRENQTKLEGKFETKGSALFTQHLLNQNSVLTIA